MPHPMCVWMPYPRTSGFWCLQGSQRPFPRDAEEWLIQWPYPSSVWTTRLLNPAPCIKKEHMDLGLAWTFNHSTQVAEACRGQPAVHGALQASLGCRVRPWLKTKQDSLEEECVHDIQTSPQHFLHHLWHLSIVSKALEDDWWEGLEPRLLRTGVSIDWCWLWDKWLKKKKTFVGPSPCVMGWSH